MHPTLISENALIAKVDGVMNAVQVESDAVAHSTTVLELGLRQQLPAVLADVIDIARNMGAEGGVALSPLGVKPESIGVSRVLPIEEIISAYYLRILAKDRPGVLAKGGLHSE